MKTENPSKSSPYRLLAFVLLLLVVPVCSPMAAPGIDVNKIPKLKPLTIEEEKAFEAKIKLLTVNKPYGDDALSYGIRLPEGWVDSRGAIDTQPGIGLSDDVLTIIARYSGPVKNFARSHVVIEAQTLKYEISAQNWFINYVLKNGLTLNAIDVRSGKELEALYVQVDRGDTFVIKAHIIINGPKLIMMRYFLPQENHEEEKQEQALITRSLKVISPGAADIEKQTVYAFLDQSYFNYPTSWTLKAKDILSIERMNVLLYQEAKEGRKSILEGHIRVNVVSKLLGTTMDQEIAAFRKSINVEGYTLGPVLESLKYNYNPEIKNGKAQAYELIASDPVNMKSYEYLASVMEGEDYYYITSMITPSRDEDFYNWAQNVETFRIVNETMRRTDAPKIDPSDPYYDYLKQ